MVNIAITFKRFGMVKKLPSEIENLPCCGIYLRSTKAGNPWGFSLRVSLV